MGSKVRDTRGKSHRELLEEEWYEAQRQYQEMVGEEKELVARAVEASTANQAVTEGVVEGHLEVCLSCGARTSDYIRKNGVIYYVCSHGRHGS